MPNYWLQARRLVDRYWAAFGRAVALAQTEGEFAYSTPEAIEAGIEVSEAEAAVFKHAPWRRTRGLIRQP